MEEGLLATKEMLEKCSECLICVQECQLMTKLGKSPRETAENLLQNPQAFKNSVYSCLLCGLCANLCPLSLSPRQMFLEWRRKLVKDGVAPFRNHSFSLTDKQWNIYTLYRENYGISYSDLETSNCDTLFFPGCNMGTFAPKLTRTIFSQLKRFNGSIGILVECCQKPIHDLGLQERFEKAIEKLKGRIAEKGAKKIITACPNCYYTLKKHLDVEVVPIYDALPEAVFKRITGTITIHDSCPDREEGIFGRKVRNLFNGCRIIEMKHCRENTLCCGAGGLASAVDPDLALTYVKMRLEEAKETQAEYLVTYCVTCVNMLSTFPSQIKIRHALNLLLDVDEDYSQIQRNLQQLFTGPKAKENVQKVVRQL